MAKTNARAEPQKMGKKSFAFRLPLDIEAAAIALAETEELSVGELAKELLINHLNTTRTQKLPQTDFNADPSAVKNMLAELEVLRANLRFATFAILVECGNAEPNEVEALLEEHWT